jgi:starch-binding outer membrane protein, SusD/RagB family
MYLSIVKNIFSHRSLLSVVFIVMLSGCSKFLDIDPPSTSLVGQSVFADEKSANAAVANVYVDLMLNGTVMSSGSTSISMRMGLYADELTLYPGSLTESTMSQFYKNRLTGENQYYFWIELFKIIYQVNNIIEGLDKSGSITAGLKNQLIGEAKFIRAFMYFHGVNLFGELPLVLTTNYAVNNSLNKTDKETIIKQVVQDLKDAKTLLNNNYPGIGDRSRANFSSAAALLARVYLYNKDWQNAEQESTVVINNPLYALNTLSEVFLKNSNESILQFQPVRTGFNTFDASAFVLTNTPGLGLSSVALNNDLVNDFEAGDLRKQYWIGKYSDTNVQPNVDYYFAYKYKIYKSNQPVTEYLAVLRLAEQYLIRSEARAQQENLTGSIDDLNEVKNRSGLAYTGTEEKSSILNDIQHERRVELFTEWGHRWFDLKRSDNFNTSMTAIASDKGTTWNPDFQLLPIPEDEIAKNPKLTQNSGY